MIFGDIILPIEAITIALIHGYLSVTTSTYPPIHPSISILMQGLRVDRQAK